MPNDSIWTPSENRPNIVVASEEDIDRLDRVIRTALTTFELFSSDINFDGMYIDTRWLTDDTIPVSASQSRTIDSVIDAQYPPGQKAIISITGDVMARDVVHFLRAIRRNNAHGPARHTQLALLKEWHQS